MNRGTASIEGVLPIHKPAGLTSHDVVAKARRILNIKRIGHTGTLDPDVSGVLPLCIGRATRVVEYIQDLPKTYEAVMHIGEASSTEDSSGERIAYVEQVDLSEEQIRVEMRRFIGEIEQVPPMYSAVKHEGKRLYDLARQGIEVQRQARTATIHAIDIHTIKRQHGHFFVRFDVTCSKGTYVRTLCADIGTSLGYPALMHALIRTASGSISLDHCLTLEQVGVLHEQGKLASALIPLDQAVAHLPAVVLGQGWTERAQNGMKLPPQSGAWPETEALVRVYAHEGNFIGIYKLQDELRVPVKIFH